MTGWLDRRSAAVLVAASVCTGTASAQVYQWSFEPGEGWPESPPGLNPGDQVTGPGGGTVVNFIGNQLFFDDNNLFTRPVAGSGGPMAGAVMWGQPNFSSGSGELDVIFDNTVELPTNVSFDFAWAAGDGVGDLLEIDVYGTTDSYKRYFTLDTPFFSSGTQGQSGRISIPTYDPDEDVDIGAIQEIYIYLDDAANGGQFAIDNFVYRTSSAPDNASEVILIDRFSGNPVVDGLSYGASWLAPSSSVNWTDPIFDVENIGVDEAEYTVTAAGPHHVSDGAGSHFLASGQTAEEGASIQLELQGLASGTYTTTLTLTNLANDEDPDNYADGVVRVYDPASATGNTGSPLDAVDGDGVAIEAGAPASHVGALRAGVRLTGVTVSGFPFQISGLEVGDFIAPGAVLDGQVMVGPGLIAGNYSGQLVVSSESDIASTFLLSQGDDALLPDLVWQVVADVPVVTSDTKLFSVGESYAATPVAVSGSKTGAAVIGGAADVEQTIHMEFVPNPEAGGATTARLVGDAVNVDFSSDPDTYVLQITYDDTGIVDETQLVLMFFDTELDAWVNALAANSDGGSGGELVFGSFADFKATMAAAELDDLLSYYGVDTEANQLWAVLDHNSVFGAGVIPEPATLALLAVGLGLLGRGRVARR